MAQMRGWSLNVERQHTEYHSPQLLLPDRGLHQTLFPHPHQSIIHLSCGLSLTTLRTIHVIRIIINLHIYLSFNS